MLIVNDNKDATFSPQETETIQSVLIEAADKASEAAYYWANEVTDSVRMVVDQAAVPAMTTPFCYDQMRKFMRELDTLRRAIDALN